MIARLWRHAGPLTMATLAVLAIMVLLEFFYFRSLSGGLASLAWRPFGFAPQQGIEWLTALGPRGAEAILVWHYLSIDLLFPALLSLTLISLLLHAAHDVAAFKAISPNRRATVALTLVLPYTVANYAQNAAVVRVLSDPLSANADTLALASTLGMLKYALLAVPLLVLGCLFAARRTKR
ncbi:hypothetical protein QBK99_15915 [Corticibacterium sp. UT-5YL-CI-8]|nr:hypothetical protein [Tianweitania sp. UT-5YL-CI-8]